MTFSWAATPAAEPAAVAATRSTSRNTRKRIAVTVLAILALSASRAAAQVPSGSDPFAAHTWHFEADTSAVLEAWNYNGSHEELYGLAEGVSYGLRDGVALTLNQRFFYVSQRANDSWVLGLTLGFRVRAGHRGRTSGFLEGDFGISDAAIAAPPHGTRFNYLALSSGGVLVRITPRAHALAALQLLHISNASLKGPGRNPDTEGLGVRLGMVLGF